MGQAPVKASRDGAVARVAMDRPEKRNALALPLVEALTAEIAKAGNDPAVRVLALAGEGPAFCAGADLEELAAGDSDPKRGEAYMRALARLLLTLRSVPAVTAALVHGPAIAGGAGLASACDLAYASDAAHFAYPEVRFGFAPCLVAVFAAESVGLGRARDLLFTGRKVDAREAKEMGLVAEVFPAEVFCERAAARLGEIAASPSGGLRTTKRALGRLSGEALERHLDEMVKESLALRSDPDYRKGVRERLKTRRP